jgi:uncharacterized RDD family membrane protein YckC
MAFKMITTTLTTGTRYSTTWKRLVAQIIDSMIIGLTTIPVTVLLHFPVSTFQLYLWEVFFIFMAYSVWFDYKQHGTPGKHIMKIKIEYSHDQRFYLLTILYRNFLKGLFGILLFDLFLILIIPYRQGLHNQIAKCSIVDERV